MKTFYFVLLSLGLLTFVSCKKDKDNNNDDKKKQVLVIENGAVSTAPDGTVKYNAALIDEDGKKTAASGVTWSSSATGVATISGTGEVTIASVGVSTIKASVTIDGTTLTAEAPLNIQVPSVFAVAPSAILVDTEFPDIQMEAIYLGTGSTTYSYQSSNTNIATVSNTGVVNFVGAGSCKITVTANGLDGSPAVVVPVVVLGVPAIKLPVARVILEPSSRAILKSETTQYTAKAYNLDNQEVSATFTWSVADESIATVDASGNITPVALGTTTVRATADGITGEAELVVVAERILLVDPYYASVAAGRTKQFTATEYQVVRNANNELALGTGSAATGLTWSIPTFGFSMFDVGTVDNNGLVSVKSSAIPGLFAPVIASKTNDPDVEPGVATLNVAVASSCNCGTQAATAASINLTSANAVTIGSGVSSQIQATVVDAAGNPVSGATLTYCSDNIQVADVDFNGEITATSLTGGTATVTVCHGNLSKTITVTVQ